MENWKTNLYRFLGPYAGILLVMIFCYLNNSSFRVFQEMVFSAFIAILVIGGFFYASSIMETMKTQEKRISYLMLPATMLEKFVSRALFVTIGFTMMMVVALLVAEVTRYLFLPLFDLPEGYHQSVLPYVWRSMTNVVGDNLFSWMTKVFSWLCVGWIYSFFVLGGCYWQRHPFWNTLAVMVLLGNVVGIALVGIVEWMSESGYVEIYARWCETHLNWLTASQVLSIAILVAVVLIALNWWLSYKLFTRSQVIKPKFRLL